MVGIELVAGYLISWVVGKGRRAGRRLDEEADEIVDAALDRLHEVVAGKLGADPALADLVQEATADGVVSDLTRRRVDLAIQAAVVKDEAFGEAIEGALRELAAAGTSGITATGHSVVAAGERSVAVRSNSGIISTGDNAINRK